MSGADAPARSFPWRACDRCEQPDQCKADSRTCADRAQFPTLCAAVEGTGLLPCPFGCQGKPHEFVSWGMQQVTCYGTGGNNHAPFTLRRDAWNTRTTPPARTYAEGVSEERARIMKLARQNLALTRGCMECNADDERRWVDTIRWLEESA